MKVKLTDMEEGVLVFLKKVIDTLPTTGHKFAAGAMLASKSLSLERLLGSLADDDGCIDTDALRVLVKGGFNTAGDKATFTVGMDALSWLLKPVSVSVTEADVCQVIDAVEARHKG